MQRTRDAYIKVLALLACSGYAAYGFATGNGIAATFFAIFAALIAWGLARPTPQAGADASVDPDRTWILPWLTITVLSVAMWAITIYSARAVVRGSDEDAYVLTAVVGCIAAIGVTRIAIPAWAWLWRKLKYASRRTFCDLT